MELSEENIFKDIARDLQSRWDETLEQRKGLVQGNIEVEARFVTFTSDSIGVRDFLRVLNELKLLAEENKWIVGPEVVSTDTFYSIEKTGQTDPTRSMDVIESRIEQSDGSGRKEYKTKTKIGSGIRNLNYAFRIGFAIEIEIKILPNNVLKSYAREKRRTTITIRNDIVDSIIEIAMTKVISPNSDGEDNITWEIEAEIKEDQGSKSFADKNVRKEFAKIIRILIKLIHGTKKLYNNEERLAVIGEIVDHLGESKRSKRLDDEKISTTLPTGFVNKPKDLLLQDLSSEIGSLFLIPYSVTLKADGQRIFCYYSKDGIYLFRPPAFFNKISNNTQDNRIGSIFDGELLPPREGETEATQNSYTILIFDVLTINIDGIVKDMRGCSFRERIKAGRYLAGQYKQGTRIPNEDMNQFEKILHLKAKRFWLFNKPEVFYKVVEKCWLSRLEEDFGNDGMIFTPVDAPYLEPDREITEFVPRCSGRPANNPTRTRKWKPSDLLTIDFKVLKTTEGLAIMSYDNRQKDNLIAFTGNRFNYINPVEDVEFMNIVDGNTVKVEDGQIAEFAFIRDNNVEGGCGLGKFRPIRLRPDKSVPNQLCVAEIVWGLVCDPIDIGILVGQTQGLGLMRKYHNRFKRTLLNDITEEEGNFISDDILGIVIKRPRLFDIGTGQGTNINAWKSGNYRVFAVEPNIKQLLELNKRLEAVMLINRRGYKNDLVNVFQAKGQETDKIVKKLRKIHQLRQDFLVELGRLRGAEMEDLDIKENEKERLRIEQKFIEEELKTNVELEENNDFVKFDAVTQFFSLTFFYDEPSNVNKLIRTIKTVLRKNGTYHCIALDGNLVLQQLQGKRTMITGNDAVRISRIGDLDNPTNRKIRIKLKGTLVDQVEYLVDFDDFISRLERNGFVLEEDKHLTAEQILSPAESWFSSMNRYIKFRYIGGVYKEPALLKRVQALMENAKFPRLTPGTRKKFPTKSLLFKDLWRVGVIGQGSCFFHGVVYGLNPKYRTLETSKKVRFVKKLRLELLVFFSEEVYKKLGNGFLAELGTNSNVHSFISMKASLANYSTWVGNEFREFVGDILDVNIHLVWWIENDLQVYRTATEGNGVFKQGRNSIVLFWQGGDHFEVVGREQDGKLGFLFQDKDALITHLRSFY